MRIVLCMLVHVFCIVNYVLWFMYYVLRIMVSVLCIALSVLRNLDHVLYGICCGLRITHDVMCLMRLALCIMYYM